MIPLLDRVSPAVRSAEARAGETIDLCRELVRTNTVNRYSGDPPELCGNETAGQDILEPILRALGARTERFECPPDIYERMGVLGPGGRDFSGRANLAARVEFGGGGPEIVLQVHMDTVGVSGMTIPPWEAEIRDGCIWGRGTSDCKGGIAAAAMALAAVAEHRSRLRGAVTFLSVVEEECNGSGAGALAACARGYGCGAAEAVCADGDTGLGRGYSGVLTVSIRVTGRAGHASGTDGVSAIEKALVLKEALDAFKRERERNSTCATVNLGIFRGGIHPAVIPGEAEMQLNLCYPIADARAAAESGAGFGGTQVRARFEELLRARETTDAWLREHPARVTWVKDLLPFETPAEHDLVRDLAETHQAVLGRVTEPYVHPAWSDACYLPRFHQVPTVLYGAGTPGKAHSPNESARVEDILDCSRVLAAFLYRRLAA